MITIDGDNLLVTLPAPTMGVLNVDVQIDLYSDWKEWMLAAFANMGYPPLFTTFGGNTIIAGELAAGSYYTFNNVAGWRIKPDESNHDVNWVGQLVPLDSSLPVFVPTTGAFTVFVNGLQPISQKVITGSGVTQQDKDDIENQIFARVVEGGFSFEQIFRLLAASAAGTITQALDGSYTITGIDATTARILGELGANNGRTITGRTGT
jgi:hypothetical protein